MGRFENITDGIVKIEELSRRFAEIGKINTPKLRALFKDLTGKEASTSDRQRLKDAVCYLIQGRNWVNIQGAEETDAVKKRRKRAIELCFSGETSTKTTISEEEERQERGEQETMATKAKPRHVGDETGQKLEGKSIAEVIDFGKKLGIPVEKLEKHRDRPVGLARMALGNMIRAALKKKK